MRLDHLLSKEHWHARWSCGWWRCPEPCLETDVLGVVLMGGTLTSWLTVLRCRSVRSGLVGGGTGVAWWVVGLGTLLGPEGTG